MNRQQTRHALFTAAFTEMPLWETWEDTRPDPTEDEPDRTKQVRNFRGISRRQRRSMARDFAKRQWRERNGTNFPITV